MPTLLATLWLSFAAQALAAARTPALAPALAHVAPFLHAPADERPVPAPDRIASFAPHRAPDRATGIEASR